MQIAPIAFRLPSSTERGGHRGVRAPVVGKQIIGGRCPAIGVSGRGFLGASCGCRTQRFARALNDLLPTVLWHEPEPRSGESVIMRIAWLAGCNLEWTQHWRVASRPEVPAADLLIVRNRLSCKKFQPTERIVLAARRHCARRRATRRKLGCV